MELMLMGRYRLLIIKIFGELDQHKASSVNEKMRTGNLAERGRLMSRLILKM